MSSSRHRGRERSKRGFSHNTTPDKGTRPPPKAQRTGNAHGATLDASTKPALPIKLNYSKAATFSPRGATFLTAKAQFKALDVKIYVVAEHLNKSTGDLL